MLLGLTRLIADEAYFYDRSKRNASRRIIILMYVRTPRVESENKGVAKQSRRNAAAPRTSSALGTCQ